MYMIELKNEDAKSIINEIEKIEYGITNIAYEMDCLEKSRDIMKEYGIDTHDVELAMFKKSYEKEKSTNKIGVLKDELESIQEKCEHTMRSLWHDSHHEYFICDKCGKEFTC